MSHKVMSLDKALDVERQEVLRILQPNSGSSGQPLSPTSNVFDDAEGPPSSSASASGQSPTLRFVQPVRSMLDIDSPPPPAPVRSMLDIDSSPATTSAQPVFSAQNSPTEPNHRVPSQYGGPRHHGGNAGGGPMHVRSMSDASSRPVDFGPRARVDPTTSYRFSDIITNVESPLPPRRTGQLPAGGTTAAKRIMAEVMRGDMSGLKLPGSSSRNQRSLSRGPSTRGASAHSKSPHNRLSVRSHSPAVPNLSTRNMSPGARAFVAETQNDALAMHNAYRRLSDANLARSGGTLSQLPMRNHAEEVGAHGSRLTKDYIGPDGEPLPDDSSDDNSSSDDEAEAQRGRKVARSFPDGQYLSNSLSPVSTRQGKQPLSLLAAAEEERIQVAASQPAVKYRSLLEPEITVTNPSGDKVKSSKPAVHPANSFEQASRSLSRMPWDSDDEAEYTDIRRAQKLPLTMTPIMSTPNIERSIRIIYRGDLAKVHKEATEEEHRRVRKYLVATDLSDESTHALEWAVGTVLRDGDTLIAIYCVDEELGIPGAETQDEPKMTREQAAAVSATSVGRMPESATAAASGSGSSGTTGFASENAGTAASSPAPLVREKSRMEEDRHRAVQEITDRITRLLRKTRLQVRVIVEVVHCKTPRHLITEVIDLINPTLVILGSRGRSALKGVILGSFSNYLVTKSSVPVMVARKRLRKGKFQRTAQLQVNNLSNPTAKSLANAKID